MPKPIDEFLPLKPNWFHILLTLAEGERHGYAIMQDVADRTDGKVRLWPATLYGTIRRLEEAGLVEETDGPADDDERRVHYRITRLGGRVLDAEATRLEQLVRLARRRGSAS